MDDNTKLRKNYEIFSVILNGGNFCSQSQISKTGTVVENTVNMDAQSA